MAEMEKDRGEEEFLYLGEGDIGEMDIGDEEEEVIFLNAGKVVAEVAKESPEAAGLMASLMERMAADREATSPTWQMLRDVEAKARSEGFVEGVLAERERLTKRFFGDGGGVGE